jgi:hypothetical protein
MLKGRGKKEATVKKLFLQAVGGLIGTNEQLIGIISLGSKPLSQLSYRKVLRL